VAISLGRAAAEIIQRKPDLAYWAWVYAAPAMAAPAQGRVIIDYARRRARGLHAARVVAVPATGDAHRHAGLTAKLS
jgi:hypothetical protein